MNSYYIIIITQMKYKIKGNGVFFWKIFKFYLIV